jgi:hypothetical protein
MVVTKTVNVKRRVAMILKEVFSLRQMSRKEVFSLSACVFATYLLYFGVANTEYVVNKII